MTARELSEWILALPEDKQDLPILYWGENHDFEGIDESILDSTCDDAILIH